MRLYSSVISKEGVTLEERRIEDDPPTRRRYVETFPIGVDDGVDHLTTQQALPAGEAACRASRILQPDGHHQTMTTKTVHALTPGLDLFGTAYRRRQPPRSHASPFLHITRAEWGCVFVFP